MAQPHRVERRRKRSFGEEVRLPPYLGSYFCCEVVSRMREDINCLCQDAKRLAKLKSEMEVKHREFEGVCRMARTKLKNMAVNKLQHHARTGVLTQMKATEARDFLKYTWSLANSALDKKAQKSKFMSMRGGRAVDYVDEVITICDTILADYGNDFHHVECSTLFNHLCRQLQNLLAPEILKADTIEFSYSYIKTAMPAMISLMSIIDVYLQYPRVSDVVTLCNELFHKSPSVSNRPCKTLALRALASLLRGNLIGENPVASTMPVVEGRATNFCQMAEEVAHYILHKSAPDTEPTNDVPQVLLGPGLLDARFRYNLPPKKIPTNSAPELPSVPVSPVSPTPLRSIPTRGRGRPRKRSMGPSDRPMPPQSPSPSTYETNPPSSPSPLLLPNVI